MDREREAKFLIEKAKLFGVRFECDCGFLVAVVTKSESEKNRQDEIILEIGQKCLSEANRLVQARAMSVRANAMIGHRLWSRHGEGEIVDGGSEGVMTIEVVLDGKLRGSRLSERPANLLLIRDEETPAVVEAKSEPAPKTLLERVRDGLKSKGSASV